MWLLRWQSAQTQFMTLMAFGCSLNGDACRRFTSKTVRSSLRRSSPLSTVFNLSMPWITEELARFDRTVGFFSWNDAEISGVMDNNVTGGNLRRSQVNVPGGGAAQTSHSYFYFHSRAERKFKGILRGKSRFPEKPHCCASSPLLIKSDISIKFFTTWNIVYIFSFA